LRIEGLLDASCKHEARERAKITDKSSRTSSIEELNDRINLEVSKERRRILIQSITPRTLEQCAQLKRVGLIDSKFRVCHTADTSAARPPARKKRKQQGLREEKALVEEEIKLLEQCASYSRSSQFLPLEGFLGLPLQR